LRGAKRLDTDKPIANPNKKSTGRVKKINNDDSVRQSGVDIVMIIDESDDEFCNDP